jgi:trehalose-phosphatase
MTRTTDDSLHADRSGTRLTVRPETVRVRAVILDLDGVITRTATLHARAWKRMFDAFLERREGGAGEDLSPFDSERDYLRYVDGKPRFDGVRSFLAARGIDLPEGDPEDSPDQDTVRGIGARKNRIFLELLDREPVQVFEDAVEQIRRWRAQGLRTALITSSRNGRRIVEAAGLEELFDVRLDGLDAERLGIAGKPAPDIFLHAAREVGVEPAEAIVVEDAIAGVEAGRAGGFALVVGVARNGGDGLREAGADLVVRDLRDVRIMESTRSTGGAERRACALEQIDAITARLAGRRLVLFLDYDGTLTPIVRRPEEAVLSDSMRTLLRELAGRVTVAIVSGRDLADVQKMVGLETLYYAGSHGFDAAGPDGMEMQQAQAQDHLPELDAAERELNDLLAQIDGAWIERKRFAIAVHYREAAEEDVPAVEAAVDEVLEAHPQLRKKGGKKIFELQPDVPWDKGRAVRWLLEQLDLATPAVLPVYIGDDVTDEDAFAALSDTGLGIRVGSPDEPTAATYQLADVAELELFLRTLMQRLPSSADVRG